MKSRAPLLASLLALACPSALVADEPTPLPVALPSGVKARLRTTTVPGLAHGIIVRTDSESVTVLFERGSEQRIRVDGLERLEVSYSQKRHTLKGAVIGTLVGVGLGFVFPVDPGYCDAYSPNFCSRGEAVAAGALSGVLVGTLVGALVKTDRWTPVDVEQLRRTTIPVARNARGPSLSITVRF